MLSLDKPEGGLSPVRGPGGALSHQRHDNAAVEPSVAPNGHVPLPDLGRFWLTSSGTNGIGQSQLHSFFPGSCGVWQIGPFAGGLESQ